MNVSVVVTTKDRPALVRNAIASVRRAAPDAEVIVVDDGSIESAAVEVREMCEDHGLRLIRNDVSRGPSSARNQGLSLASEPYWAALDDDDEWLSNRWRAMREMLERQGFPPDLVAVSGFRSIASNGDEEHVSPRVDAPARFESLSRLFSAIRPRVFLNTFIAPTALVRELGGYDERMRWGEHTDLLIRLAKVARFGAVDEETVAVHVPAVGQGRNWPAKVEGIQILLRKHERDFQREREILGSYRHVLGVTQLRCGDRWGAVRTFAGLVSSPPSKGRRPRAFAHLALAALGGETMWRRLSSAAREMQEQAGKR